jgi:exopolyphosphatase/pppGpp-phosphohydrolase
MGTHGPVGQRVATLHLGDDASSLVFSAPPGTARVVPLAFGVRQLVREVLQHTPPTPGELELAIALIEDEVMKAHKLLPTNAALRTTNACLWDVALVINPDAQAGLEVSIDAVEQVFDLLVALSMGRPASIAGIPGDARFAAALLILRELMHHLYLRSIHIHRP